MHTVAGCCVGLGLEMAARETPPPNTTPLKQNKLRGKSFIEKPPMGRVAGLIKSCCHCGVLVTRSHTITEISVWEESAPTTHFLPTEGGAKWDRLLYKIPRERERIIFHLKEFENPKGRRGQGVGEQGWENPSCFWMKLFWIYFTHEIHFVGGRERSTDLSHCNPKLAAA